MKKTITTEERNKLTNLENYDDTEIKLQINTITNQINGGEVYKDLTHMSSNWVRGAINTSTGEVATNNSRVCCNDIFKFDYDITFKIDYENKYLMGFLYYSEDESTFSWTGWTNKDTFTIPANKKFKIALRCETIVEPSVADINTFLKSYKFNTVENSIIKDIKYLKDSIQISNPIQYKGNEIFVFNKGICIGDSLTAGVFNKNETGSTVYQEIPNYSYPKILSKMTGIELVNKGISGCTTKSWYETNKNEDLSGYDFAIVNLGANDTDGKITIDESKNNLQNIITKLQNENKGIKIFICTILPAYYTVLPSRYKDINTTRKELVQSNSNCYYVDLSTYSDCKNGTAYAQGHLTALGYRKEAEELKSYISYIISKNLYDFKFIQFIGTNYSWS